MPFIVTEAANRPARIDGACFYCNQSVGAEHKDDCVLVKKRVKVRAVIEYEVEVPASWDAHMIEFHRNDGSWCADNIIDELEALAEADGCLCNKVQFTYLADTSGPALGET